MTLIYLMARSNLEIKAIEWKKLKNAFSVALESNMEMQCGNQPEDF